jgi:chemotaxis signal transduction protein
LAVHDAEQKVRVGLLVDEVKAIRVIEAGEIQALTHKGDIHTAVQPYAYGRYEEIVMLDINRLFNSPDMAQIGLKA